MTAAAVGTYNPPQSTYEQQRSLFCCFAAVPTVTVSVSAGGSTFALATCSIFAIRNFIASSIFVSDAADDVAEVAGWLTPRVGGVGPMTRAMLLANAVSAAERSVGVA